MREKVALGSLGTSEQPLDRYLWPEVLQNEMSGGVGGKASGNERVWPSPGMNLNVYALARVVRRAWRRWGHEDWVRNFDNVGHGRNPPPGQGRDPPRGQEPPPPPGFPLSSQHTPSRRRQPPVLSSKCLEAEGRRNTHVPPQGCRVPTQGHSPDTLRLHATPWVPSTQGSGAQALESDQLRLTFWR